MCCQCLLILVLAVDLILAQHCPTWFQSRSAANDSYCECGSSLSGVVKCDNITKQVSLAIEYCMTYSNVSGKEQQVVGFTNTIFLRDSTRAYKKLPGNVSELNDFMCSDSSRKGLLCGECISGYGYAVNSYNNECAKCDTAYALSMFLVCAILPMTLCFFAIVIIRLNITSGFLLGYILFCQCTSFHTIYTVLYDDILSNLNSFGQFSLKLSMTMAKLTHYFLGVYYLVEPTCIHHSISGLQAVFIQYTYCLYPLFLLFVTWLCIHLHAKNCKLVVFASKPFRRCLVKVQRNWNVSDSVIHAYATFHFLSFLHLVQISYNIINPLKVYNMNYTVTRTVLEYEPTMEWFGYHHLLYAIPAMVLLFFLGVLPTLLLCQQSTRIFRKCLTFGSHTQLILQTFADKFTSCYKDGFNDTVIFVFSRLCQ